jgi:capsular polysaccharide biosynthesis protein
MTGAGSERHSFARAVEVVHGGFVTPHRASSAPGRLSGCVYAADGSKVALSERFGGHLGDHFVSDNPATASFPTDAPRLAGRGLYLGHEMGGHYGHFITEGLSSFWALEEFPSTGFDYFLFHPFVFGDARPSYVRFCLERFGIAEDKVHVVGAEPIRFEELVVPERLFRLNHSADPKLRWVYGQIAQGLAPPAGSSSRVYISRRRFSRRYLDRVVANEVWVERAFEDHGFEVLYPEQITFPEQVARYRNAEVVAGISGSGLHNSIFMREGCVVLELGDPRYGGRPAPTQVLCNTVSGVHSTFIPFTGNRFGLRTTMLFDIAFLRSELARAAASGLPGAPSTARPSRAGLDLAARLEVLYLATRPSAGHLARDLLKGVRRRDG